MPLWMRRGGGTGLPEGGLPGQLLGKTVEGETVWVDPAGGGIFRGEWGPDALAYSYGFGAGLSPYVGTRSGVLSGSRDDVPIVVLSTEPGRPSPPVSANAALMRLRNNAAALFSDLALDLTLLDIPGVTRVKFKHAATITTGTGVRFGTFVGAVEALQKGAAAFGWESGQVTAGSTDTIHWRAHVPSGSAAAADSRYYVTDIEVYANEAPYMLNEFVTYDGLMWKSMIDDNATTPGVTGAWVQALELPQPSGNTAARPDPVTAGAGFMYFDTTLGKPIWSNGTTWVDAIGLTA